MVTSFPLHKIKVVLLENIHPDAVAVFERAGYSVELHTVAYEGEDLLKHAADAHILGVRSKSRVRADFIQNAPRLWGIGCFCIGTDQVDLSEAAANGVPVFNAPFSNTRSVAEKTIAEVVILHRKLAQRSAEMHQGRWQKSAVGVHEIRGRTLGIVGYGRIGSQVAVLAEALGMQVLFYDVEEKLVLGNSRRLSSLDELLAASDVVTLHVPKENSTRGLIGAAELAKMKQGAFLINNARGTVLDIDALADSIRSGHLGGAAIDVFPAEPRSSDAPFESPLCGLPNVVLTPHIGGSTAEAQANIAESVGSRLVRWMNSGGTQTAVNVPQVQLPLLHTGCHRILHYHRNVPGVLGELHSRIASFGVNIVAQYLQTDTEHAYAIVDVQTPYGENAQQDRELKEALNAVPETIRVRTLW